MDTQLGSVEPMYGFLRRPRWLVAHVLVAVLLTTFVGAGLWQWSRHNSRQDQNADILARRALPPIGAADLAQLDPDRDEFRLVELNGRLIADDVVRIRNRSQNGVGGCHVVAPIDLGDGTGAAVTIGWLSEFGCADDAIGDAVTLPSGDVFLEGRLRATQTRGSIGPRDPASGRLATLARMDVERYDAQVPLELASMYIELIALAPEFAGPTVLDEPETDAGPHLGYAVQWFLFFGVGVVGYPLVLRHQARRGYLDDLADVPD